MFLKNNKTFCRKKSETPWFLEQPSIQPPLPTPGRGVARLALVGAEVTDVGGNSTLDQWDKQGEEVVARHCREDWTFWHTIIQTGFTVNWGLDCVHNINTVIFPMMTWQHSKFWDQPWAEKISK